MQISKALVYMNGASLVYLTEVLALLDHRFISSALYFVRWDYDAWLSKQVRSTRLDNTLKAP